MKFMKSRKALLKKSQLYLILNKQNKPGKSLEKFCSKLTNSGIDIVQLRDKSGVKQEILKLALKLSAFFAKSKTLFIVNDHIDIALSSEADGVHLGQSDAAVRIARKILGKDKIIGISCHSLAQARKAEKEGADYIGIGPVYATPTKPEYKAIGLNTLCRLKDKIKIPYFAIGDIHHGNLKGVVLSGAERIAVCRAILKSKNPKLSAIGLKKILKKI